MAATEGAFDGVPVAKIKAAQASLLQELKSQHKAMVETLGKGDKPTDDMKKTILKVAQDIAEGHKEA